MNHNTNMIPLVAPFVGAWIEIPDSRVSIYVSTVAPFVGAWIEIFEVRRCERAATGRSVRRSVD